MEKENKHTTKKKKEVPNGTGRETAIESGISNKHKRTACVTFTMFYMCVPHTIDIVGIYAHEPLLTYT